MGRIFAMLVALNMLTIIGVSGQGSNMSTPVFSPLTAYGVGQLMPTGNGTLRGMGGIGIGYRSTTEFNYDNVASLSAIPRNAAVFNFTGELRNTYSQTAFTKTAHNAGDLSSLSFAFPVAPGIGVGLALRSFSSVGYKNTFIDEKSDLTQNIGREIYSYSGEGGVSQLSMGIGAMPFKGLSVGLMGHYYFSTIQRYWTSTIIPTLVSQSFTTVYSSKVTNVSHLAAELGLQYSHRLSRTGFLTGGLTFQPATTIKARNTINTGIIIGESMDSVSLKTSRTNLVLPRKIGVGVYYQNSKVGYGIDFTQQDWTNSFEMDPHDPVSLSVLRELRLGAQWTPNRGDIRYFWNRWTYRAGYKYSSGYLRVNDNQVAENALTLGLAIPLNRSRRGISTANIAFEMGKRGSLQNTQIKENFFKMVVSFNFFGEDQWFVKPKFN